MLFARKKPGIEGLALLVIIQLYAQPAGSQGFVMTTG
jgi:hypothetical protein